jgi:uncharacterized protein YdeI (YjbR/CyaY-like superfamily)
MRKVIPAGVVHQVPNDLRALLVANSEALAAWADLTPLARNEWICWILSAKKQETRVRKIERIRSDLLDGKRRPCCWPGCQHRTDK